MATTITRKQIREGAAADAGLLTRLDSITTSDIDSSNLTINLGQLFTKKPDKFMVADSWVTENGDDYARILKYYQDEAPHRVTVDHIPTGLTGNAGGNTLEAYSLLSPETWNDCINEALEELFKVIRVEITIVGGQSEYACDSQVDPDGDTCTWLQSRTQIYSIEYRAASGSQVSLEQLGGVRFLESSNALTVHLSVMPLVADSGASLILVARKPYVWRGSTLDADSDTTTCPYKLAMIATQIKALRVLFKSHGEQVKRNFAAALAVAEKEYVKMVNEFVPAARPQPLMIDEAYEPDLPTEMQRWSW